MKKKYWIIIVGFVVLIWLGSWALFNKDEVGNAQIADFELQKSAEERQKRIARDQNVSKEKIEQAAAEAKKIIDVITKIMSKKKPEFKIVNRYSSTSTPEGRLGTTLDDIAWESTKTRISLQIGLGLNKEEELNGFRKRISGISMGEFFPLSNIGDQAVLVKNIQFNSKNTNVGVHFVKGRTMVDIYIANNKRKSEENEKELMEILRLIEPVIIARPNFDD